jgi:phosphatidylinositol alpha-1,6-mannosyltransferase
MKILYLTPGCFDKGGISRYNRFQIQAIREIVGDSNAKVYSVRQTKQGDFEEPFDVSWVPHTDFHLVNKVEFASMATLEAFRWRPDIIWVAHVYMSGFALMLGKLVNAKVVVNAYGLEIWSGLGKLREWGLKSANEVISDCFFTARYLEQNRFRPQGSVHVIWDAVDVARFYPAKPSIAVLDKYGIPSPNANINLLTLGRIVEKADHKGYRRLLEAFSIAAKEIDSLQLTYAGSGDLVGQLRLRAAELGLASRVHFTGSIDDKDLPDVYRSAHLFSLISDRGQGRGEGVPVTPLEAAACGVPILVGNQDGSPEAVVDGVDGYVLDSFDISSHARFIVKLSADPALRRRMGEAASQKVRSEFPYPVFREKHRTFLRSLIPH